ncbi:amino acid ABC transporter permease [Achromobacter anxifer]|uniref:amino acid ABC transporter permease n=1 Tax=Achromobacter anxifer TaxID=1287737 RepID=UPI00155BCAC9|nr:amino acid ABC transporter permease [Achromobacter anxifer]MDF8365584.1 amino acid ABC transporter permease [Achromobacter anxifer]CAB5515064.1 Glutamate/aspartate import permease protein GltK [Achromobacter anxifer]
MNGVLDVSVIVKAWPFLLEGLGLSLLLTLVAMAGGLALGLLLALARLSRHVLVAGAAAAYVNGFRAVPLILVIFWFYFLVPLIVGRPVGALPSALIAFTLFEAAYYSEIIRAGLQSVRVGQWQAAAASGLSRVQALRFVVLPQALRNMMPVLITQAIVLFQDTSLVYVISLRDFMTSTSIVANRDNRLIEMYLFAALVYFVLCASLSLAAHLAAKRRSAT